MRSAFRILAVLLATAAGSLMSVLLGGCEISGAKSSTSPVSINPETVSVSAGQSVEFEASGGYDYTWSLADAAGGSGILNTTEGARVVYTCRSANSGSQKLNVTSTIQGTSSGSTSNSSYRVAASATIYFQAETTNAPSAQSLSVSASATTLSTNATATLTATGGTPPYNWTKSNGSIGTLSGTTGSSITYTATGGSGNNTVTGTDGVGTSRSVTITQL